MKKFTTSLLALAMASTVALTAQAEDSGVYGGLSTGFVTYEESGFSDYDLSFIQLQAGNRFNENMALEMRVGHGMSSDSHDEGPVKVNLEAGFIVSAFAKGILPLGPVDLYALAGFTYSQLKAEASVLGTGAKASEDDSETDFSYGAGVSIAASDTVNLFVEYTNLYDKDSVEIAGYTLGVNFKF